MQQRGRDATAGSWDNIEVVKQWRINKIKSCLNSCAISWRPRSFFSTSSFFSYLAFAFRPRIFIATSLSLVYLVFFLLPPSLTSAADRESDPGDGRLGTAVPSPSAPQDLVWQIIDAPTEAIAARRLKELGRQANKWTWKQLEAWVRQGPARPASVPTGLSDREIALDHVNWTSSYFLYVPKTYDPSKTYPLLIVMNGGNADMSINKGRNIAWMYLQPWIEMAEQRGWILASPAASKGWGHMGYSLALSVIRELQARYRIDPDRVYGWGQSMGGHACWRLAKEAPDRWAGLAPVCGGYKEYADAMVVTNNLALYQVWGEQDAMYDLNKTNEILAKRLREFGYDHRIVGKAGGHELFQDEFPKILEYFEARPRNLYPAKVIGGASGTPVITSTSWEDPKKEYEWKQPIPWTKRAYWLECTEREEKVPVKLTGERTGSNAFTLTAEGVKTLTIYLHDPLVDFEKPVTITINHQPPIEVRVQRSSEVLFNELRTYRDWGRIFSGKIVVEFQEGVPTVRP